MRDDPGTMGCGCLTVLILLALIDFALWKLGSPIVFIPRW